MGSWSPNQTFRPYSSLAPLVYFFIISDWSFKLCKTLGPRVYFICISSFYLGVYFHFRCTYRLRFLCHCLVSDDGWSPLHSLYFYFFSPKSFHLHPGAFKLYLFGGILISMHWLLFFYAIKISSISLTLSILSSASLMTSFLEPCFTNAPCDCTRYFWSFCDFWVILNLWGAER